MNTNRFLILVLIVLNSAELWASNCTLRNPDREIFQIYPEANRYRSDIGKIDRSVKTAVEKCIGETLLFSDLGKHTLYTVFDDMKPIGFVHSRTGVGKNGTVEVVWGIDLDMNIVDFKVRRSREKHSSELENTDFLGRVLEKNEQTMLNLLNESKIGTAADVFSVSEDAKEIAQTVILSGAKTLVISRMAFGKSVLENRLFGNLYQKYPDMIEAKRVMVEGNGPAVDTVFDAESIIVLKAMAGDASHQGTLVYTTFSNGAQEIWWFFGKDGNLTEVRGIGPRHGRLGEMGSLAADGVYQNEFAGRAMEEVKAYLASAGLAVDLGR